MTNLYILVWLNVFPSWVCGFYDVSIEFWKCDVFYLENCLFWRKIYSANKFEQIFWLYMARNEQEGQYGQRFNNVDHQPMYNTYPMGVPMRISIFFSLKSSSFQTPAEQNVTTTSAAYIVLWFKLWCAELSAPLAVTSCSKVAMEWAARSRADFFYICHWTGLVRAQFSKLQPKKSRSARWIFFFLNAQFHSQDILYDFLIEKLYNNVHSIKSVCHYFVYFLHHIVLIIISSNDLHEY